MADLCWSIRNFLAIVQPSLGALMDPLSDVLSLLKPRAPQSCGFEGGGAWSVRFSNLENTIKCYAVTVGAFWLVLDGVPEPVRLEAGDCYVLPSGRSFRLCSSLDLDPVDSDSIWDDYVPGGVVRLGTGDEASFNGSRFAVSSGHAKMLLGMLPPFVHVRQDAERTALRSMVERMRDEIRDGRPGSALMLQHLAHMVLIQALRLYREDGAERSDWLQALGDRPVGLAIAAMHAKPGRRWTLRDLAGEAGMSRSSFAERFKAKVGLSPLEYLARWRMLLAGERLASGAEPVSAISLSLGYESESAFATAFKRVMGCTPRRYGREARRAQADREDVDA